MRTKKQSPTDRAEVYSQIWELDRKRQELIEHLAAVKRLRKEIEKLSEDPNRAWEKKEKNESNKD